MKHHGQHTSVYEYQQVDVLILQETEQLPSGLVWTD